MFLLGPCAVDRAKPSVYKNNLMLLFVCGLSANDRVLLNRLHPDDVVKMKIVNTAGVSSTCIG